ncbi:macrolide ABC transporter ATP-binding protein [Nanoarchaeota archaeon]|nr:MAG: macrolide ABC transporter ATP-binding protein [Nanoarchaeota archaeon]
MKVIELKKVSKKYVLGRPFYALKDINLCVEKGEFLSILGPSGSGKSTLLHIMGLLDTPSSGEVIFKGRDALKMSEDERAEIRSKEIGFVFQFFYLSPFLTAKENVMLPMMFAGEVNEERAEELLKKVGLGDKMDNKPYQLSGGERQRVAIARALANEPSLILADEPTGNLDSKTGKDILKLFKEIWREGNTIVFVTHDKELSKAAERKVHLLDGRIVG